MLKLPQIILASGSPRRAELLDQIRVDFIIRTHEIDEKDNVPAQPVEYVSEVSRRKTQSIAIEYPDRIVVGADTIVVVDQSILGKPTTPDDARFMLRLLSGREHSVFSGVTVAYENNIQTEVEQTRVYFRELSEDEISEYILTDEPMDKAGAYGIQGMGALLVEKIDGCYFNVMGFPLTRFYKMMLKLKAAKGF